jgi:hypothetical protein
VALRKFARVLAGSAGMRVDRSQKHEPRYTNEIQAAYHEAKKEEIR